MPSEADSTAPSFASVLSQGAPSANAARISVPHPKRKSALDEDALDENKKRCRKEGRVLQPIPFVGLGYHRNSSGLMWMFRDIEIMSTYPRVWWHRTDITKSVAYEQGPFNDTDFLEWMLSKERQLQFAERFYIPVANDGTCFRNLTNDRVPFQRVDDATSRVLFAAAAIHPPTFLDTPLTPEIEEVIIPQFHKDMLSVKALQGVEGGIVGRDTTVFWMMSINDELHVSPKQFLSCVAALSQVLTANPNPKSPFWPGVNTTYTTMKQDARLLALKGVSYKTNGRATHLAEYHTRLTVQDIDMKLRETVQEYRNYSDDCVKNLLVAAHKQCNDPRKAGKAVPEHVEQPAAVTTSGLFDAHLHIDVFRGLDHEGNFAFIKLHCFRITPKVPGLDPCVAIQQWWESTPSNTQMGKKMKEQKAHIMHVLDHMSVIINQVLFAMY